METDKVLGAVTSIANTFDLFKDDVYARMEALTKQIADERERREKAEAARDFPGTPRSEYSREQREHLDRFNKWLRRPLDGSVKRALDEAQSEMEHKRQIEGKAVTVGSAVGGGYAVPEILDRQIEERATLLNPFRKLVRVVPVGSRDWKSLVSRNEAGSGWVAEAGTRSETGTSELRERAPTFGTLYAYPKASEEAMQDIFFDVGAWLVEECGDAFSVAEATAIVSGNGSARPTGFAATTPVTTVDSASPERAAGALQYLPFLTGSPEAPSADKLIDLSLSIKEKYLQDATSVAWVMSRATTAVVRKLKDSYGQYLWQPGLAAGQPATLLGYPVALSDAMAAPTSNNYCIAFGNWRRGYILADRVGTIRITVDDNISTPGYTKFYVRKVVGGCVYNHEAVKLLKYAST
jgi:HK97 family phage major capsid protein